jgi:hypothetical protein
VSRSTDPFPTFLFFFSSSSSSSSLLLFTHPKSSTVCSVYTQLCISNLRSRIYFSSFPQRRTIQYLLQSPQTYTLQTTHTMALFTRVGLFFALAVSIQAEQMLAIAPVTALARWDGLSPRQLFGRCPASTQTLCPDHVGCCPRGAACTFSRDIPVCNESCSGGPSCPRGGCCQVGYVCGTVNNLCTPAPTASTKKAEVEVPVTVTASASAITHAEAPVEHSSISTSAKAAPETAPVTPSTIKTTTTMPKHAGHELPHQPESTTSKASTPIVRASSSHHVAPTTATATTTTATAHDGKHVGIATGSGTKAASPSAQTASSGAAFLFVSGTNGFLVGMILGWLVSYCVLQ